MNQAFFLKKWVYLGVLLFFVISCGKPEPIIIGMVASMSGRRSQLGVSARNAVLMAVKQVNDQGGINGRPIELIIKDNKNDVAECKKVIDELINEGVVAIIGPVMSKFAATILEATSSNILVISPTVSTTDLENLDDFFIRLMPVASREAERMTDVILNEDLNRLGIIYDASNKAYTLPIFKTFSERMTRSGGKIVYSNDMTQKGEQQFTKMAQEVIHSGAQAVYIVSSGIDAAFFCQQVRKQNHTLRFFASHWVKSGNIIAQGGKSVEGMVLVTPFERIQKSKAFLDFSTNHKKMFQSEPNFVAKYSYETAQVLFEGIRASKTLSAQGIKNAILEINKFEGLEEPFTINEFGDALRSNTVLVIENGKFKRRPE